MLNKVMLNDLYIDQRLSTTDISKKLNIPLSRVRKLLIDSGIELRSRADGIRLAAPKLGLHCKGKTRLFSEETREKLSIAKLNNPKTKGTRITSQGYVEFTIGENKGRREHVVIMERNLGRRLTDNECVHHLNHVKDDNRIKNLMLMTISDHAALHAKENIGNRNRDNLGRLSC